MSKSPEVILREFEIENIPKSCSMLLIAPPGSGKTTFLENLAYYNKDKFPTATIYNGSGNPKTYQKIRETFGDLYFFPEYAEDPHTSQTKRQKIVQDEGCQHPGQMMAFDDLGDDSKIFKKKPFRGMYKIGTNHWAELAVIASQYAVDYPADIRTSASFVALGVNKDKNERDKLYKYYGGPCGTREDFDVFMDAIGEKEHTFLVIQRLTQSNKIQDRVFWYQTKRMEDILPSTKGKWQFGCREYRYWNDQRVNPNYKEEF